MIKIKIDEKTNNFSNTHNRGMTFEKEINESNEFYKDENIALIYKRPTPIKVIKSKNSVITEAVFEDVSTTDYNGVYKGRYIDFEAKETTSKTSLSLANIQKHQLEHMENVIKNGGISFLFVNFIELDLYYILSSELLLNYIKENKKKSIPVSYFEEHAYKVKRMLNPPLNYIEYLELQI